MEGILWNKWNRVYRKTEKGHIRNVEWRPHVSKIGKNWGMEWWRKHSLGNEGARCEFE